MKAGSSTEEHHLVPCLNPADRLPQKRKSIIINVTSARLPKLDLYQSTFKSEALDGKNVKAGECDIV